MGLGAMMAGGNPEEGRQDDDFYATPPEATEALLAVYGPFLARYNRFLEPCCGDGAISKVLRKHYLDAAHDAFDLVDRGYGFKADIFKMTKLPYRPDAVITNPPFNLAEEIVWHVSMNWKPRVLALLLKSTFWHADERTKLFDTYRPSMILALPWRLDFMGKGRPTMECSWFIWDVDRPSPLDYPIYRIAPNMNPKKRKPRRGTPGLPVKV